MAKLWKPNEICCQVSISYRSRKNLKFHTDNMNKTWVRKVYGSIFNMERFIIIIIRRQRLGWHLYWERTIVDQLIE